MHVVEIAERYGLLLEIYLGSCGCHRRELLLQHQVMESLISVATAAQNIPHSDKDRRNPVVRDELKQLNLPAEFTLPLNPQWMCKGIITEKAKAMSSKKVPLWLEFENSEEGAPNFVTLFKAGDDLRQDLLTLQLLRIMDTIWKSEGLDLKVIPYGCVSTGDDLGCVFWSTRKHTAVP
eukprot:COSAG06_NODE_523_length_14708_cov_16.526593_6_plen_178_part_00